MSLLSAVTNVANEAAYVVDTVAIGSLDATTKQLVAIANRVIWNISDAYPWPKLFKTASITLTASQSSYALPGDFSYYHWDTFWNQTNRWRVFGPMSPQEYAEAIGFQLTALPYTRFMLRGVTDNQFTVYPTPGATETGQVIIFEYATSRSVRPRTWAAGQIYTAASYTFYNGIYYYTTAGGTTSGTTGPTGDGGVTWTVYTGPYDEFLSDTDEPIFDQKLLEQGMLERFGAIHGLDSIKPEFDALLDQEYGKQVPGKTLFAAELPPKRLLYAQNDRAVFGRGIP